MFYRLCFLMVAGIILLAGCENSGKPVVNYAATDKKPTLTAPFKYHKLIEVAPGQYYDILSWGRGSADTGAFVILHSDSSGKKYTTTTGDLNGVITDVYNTDMDVDGNPEILIQAAKKDTINYTSIYAFEFSDNKAQKLDFPKLTSAQKKGYRGNDNFYIEQGKLIREFPIFNGAGKDAKQSGQKRKLEYGLHNNEFTVKQLSKDSTAVSATVKQPVNQSEKNKNTPAKKAKAKHHEQVKHRAHKKKHHHRNDDN